MWWVLLVAGSVAAAPEAVQRWFVAPEQVPALLGAGDTTLRLENPHRARSVLEIDGVKLGEVWPRATVVLEGLSDAPRDVCWITPHGWSRCEVRAPSPAR